MADRLIEMRAVADMPGTSMRIASEDLRAIVARIDAQAAEIERMRGVLLWTLWHHQGGSSPIGQPIRRALGMGQFDPMTPEQIECGQRFGTAASREWVQEGGARCGF